MFRILYSFEEQIAVTGVGFVDDPGAIHLVAPLDFGARWDTSEFNTPNGVTARRQSMVGTAFPSMKLVGHFWSKPIPQNRFP